MTFLIFLLLFVPTSFAQDYTQWDLPESARARLGQGSITGNIAYSPDGTSLAVAGSIGIWVYDTMTHQEVALLTGHTSWVESVVFSPDGTTIASGSNDRTVRLWDVATGAHRHTLTGHTGWVESVVFSPDGTTLASGSTDKTVRLWDVATGAHQHTLTGHTGWVESVVFSPAGITLASGGGRPGNTVRLWDVATGTHRHTLTGHTSAVLNVALSPDGNTVASGSKDKTVRLWNVATGAHRRTLTGHAGEVNSVVFSPDGTTLASGSEDGTILLWELPHLTGDVNQDGIVNIQDLVLVGSNFGKTAEGGADINGDGVIDLRDLVLVARAFESAGAAPAIPPQPLTVLTAAAVRGWLTQAQGLDLTVPAFQRGILMLQQLLAALTLQETVLLPNYPNPFNPETWIPYHLAEAADVTLTVYDTKGAPVFQLDLGHQPAGDYTTRTRAAYWDGQNENGELVASGVYFYQLRAGNYTAVQRMVIVK